jgi:DNA-binding LacI/PurR family transcriptional regulator
MERLDREGWVDRQAGRGTFVGERVLLLDEVDDSPNAVRDAKYDDDEQAIRNAIHSAAPRSEVAEPVAPARRERVDTLRIAVLISQIEDLSHDWFSLGVISGLDSAAAERGGQIEIIGSREARPDILADRLTRARPDALAYLGWRPEYLSLLEVGHRVGFPTIFGNTAFARSRGTHSVCEDNEQAVELAVDALWDAGHRRIGLAINRWPEPWVFERHRAFDDAIRRRDGRPSELRTAWLDSAKEISDREVDQNNEAMADRLEEYLHSVQPTALLCASQVVSDVLCRLVQRGSLSIPNDLSVVCIDQLPDLAQRLGIVPTVVCLPLEEIGRCILDVAETITNRPEHDTSYLARRVPCQLKPGRSIRDLDR